MSFTPFLQPPPVLTSAAYPLLTSAWVKMQTVVNTSLAFPLSVNDFVATYGTFSDEGIVEAAVAVLSAIQQTSGQYGDPKTLISEISSFQSATTPPASVYGHAVWLAAQTQVTAEQIVANLTEGLNDIATETDSSQRLADLTDLLTGDGGINSQAATLQGNIADFQKKATAFYNALNQELTGDTKSLQVYLNTTPNVLSVAQAAYSSDETEIKTITDDVHELNKKYIEYVIAAALAPLFSLIPLVGGILSVADATTFGILAKKVHDEIDALNQKLKGVEEDDQKKHALITVLTHFNAAVADVQADGLAFVKAIGDTIGGWAEFQTQITSQLKEVTVADLSDMSAFLEKVHFQSARDGWNTIASNAEAFVENGFVKFSPRTSNSSFEAHYAAFVS